MTWQLIEPCCGSAALSVSYMGGRSLMPYQGSKWSLRGPLRQLIERHGFTSRPARFTLLDAGPWGQVWQALSWRQPRERTIELLGRLVALEPRELYDTLHGHEVPEDPAAYAAEFLWLQRMAHTGKAVSDADGVWRSPGFSDTNAYGCPATGDFGEVKPQGPSLLRRLRRFPWSHVIVAHRQDARHLHVNDECVVYLDPPYVDTTGYPGGTLERDEVCALAERWRSQGATVLISEGEPIAELGWHSTRIRGERVHNGSPFKVKREEWVTHSGEALPLQPSLFADEEAA